MMRALSAPWAKGETMKKLVLMLVVAAVAASPAMAATKKKKMTKQETEAAEISKQNDNTRRALRDALPLALPSWSLPIFFGMKMDEKLKESDKKEAKPSARKPRKTR
ncbi:MAG: hypothetical protein Q8K85_14325 [Hyphomicrobium sp.]|nr:hypothetical protein [Hyphomicrobium sp.]